MAADPVADRPEPPRGVEPTRAAWCVPDPADPDGELIVGAGPPVKTFCSYTPMHDAPSYCPAPCPTRNPARANHLFQTAGSTILMSATEGVVRVAHGRLTRLDDAADSHGIGLDGRYLATTSGQCGAVTLHVHEIATATEVAKTGVPNPGHTCASVAGLDDAGRVYVPVHVEGNEVLEVLMYDIRANQWATVTDIPNVDGHFPTITYMTATGFAVASEQTWSTAASIWVALASVEGVVDTAGRFTPQRQVPVGMGVWSPDRTYVAEGRLEGVVVRPAADLTEPVMLDLPVGQSELGAWGSNIHWETSTSVLVQGFGAEGSPAYRCDVRSGECRVVHRTGSMALGENAAYGG